LSIVAGGSVARDADVVCVLTGHVLKDTAYAERYHASSAPLANPIVRGAELGAYVNALLLART